MKFSAGEFRAIAERATTDERARIANTLAHAAIDGRAMAIINGHEDNLCPHMLEGWLKENGFRTDLEVLADGAYNLGVYW